MGQEEKSDTELKSSSRAKDQGWIVEPQRAASFRIIDQKEVNGHWQRRQSQRRERNAMHGCSLHKRRVY